MIVTRFEFERQQHGKNPGGIPTVHCQMSQMDLHMHHRGEGPNRVVTTLDWTPLQLAVNIHHAQFCDLNKDAE